MNPKIDLFCFNEPFEKWENGALIAISENVSDLDRKIQTQLKNSSAEYFLFWDSYLGKPDEEILKKIIDLPGDVWHAGLKLGASGLPRMINFVEPIWMLNKDPDLDVAATSWRISLKACLVRTKVLKQLGGLDPFFKTVMGAGLDLGCRFIRRGAIVRHIPWLISQPAETQGVEKIPISDEMRFILNQYGWKWLYWTMMRAFFRGYPISEIIQSYRDLKKKTSLKCDSIYHPKSLIETDTEFLAEKVSILIPTLNRYSYLRNELKQLASQTVKAHEIIIVDQTPQAQRDFLVKKDFKHLPIKLIHQDTQGQCTAWNEAIRQATGEHVLFLGDDADHIHPNFIELFLKTMNRMKCDMVACYVEERGVKALPENSTFMRVSDTFPICMIRKSQFLLSGMLDYTFDRGARADAELALRLVKRGSLMIYNPEITIYHHRAPVGGLRAHRARVQTSASTKQKLFHQNIPSSTEIYLVLKHFSKTHLRELCYQRIWSSFVIHRNIILKLIKIMASIFLLPLTAYKIKRNTYQAYEWLKESR